MLQRIEISSDIIGMLFSFFETIFNIRTYYDKSRCNIIYVEEIKEGPSEKGYRNI